VPGSPERDLVTLSDALTELATVDARMSQVVELRFLAASPSKKQRRCWTCPPETVMRDWRTAKAWLLREIRCGQPTASS